VAADIPHCHVLLVRCRHCGRGIDPAAGRHRCPGADDERRRGATAAAVRHLESLGYAVTPPAGPPDARR
jgi:hypothetical protein